MTPSHPQSSGPPQLADAPSSKEREKGSMSVSSLRSRRLLKWFGLGLLLAVAIACLLLELQFGFANKKNTPDFLAFYAAGTILRQGLAKKLYDPGLQAMVEQHLRSPGAFLPFYHPPFEAWLFEPLARLPLSLAFLLWSIANLVVLGLIFLLLPRTGYRLSQDQRLVWLFASFPIVVEILVLGQDSLLLGLIFLLAFLALKRRRDYTAGVVLGLGLFRFETVLPFLFIFMLRRRWKVFASFLGVALAELLASAALVGWGGLLMYLRVLFAVGHAAGNREWVDVTAMPSLRGFLATLLGRALPDRALFVVILAGSMLLLAWAARRFVDLSNPAEGTFDLGFSLATIVALVVSYHVFLQSLSPMIVVAFLLLGYENSARRNSTKPNRLVMMLLLLFALIPLGGLALDFLKSTFLFVVLMGLALWCSWKIQTADRSAVHI